MASLPPVPERPEGRTEMTERWRPPVVPIDRTTANILALGSGLALVAVLLLLAFALAAIGMLSHG